MDKNFMKRIYRGKNIMFEETICNNKKTVDFQNVCSGQVFFYNEIPYMKLEEEYKHILDDDYITTHNVVNLKTGYLEFFQDGAYVNPVKIKLDII